MFDKTAPSTERVSNTFSVRKDVLLLSRFAATIVRHGTVRMFRIDTTIGFGRLDGFHTHRRRRLRVITSAK